MIRIGLFLTLFLICVSAGAQTFETDLKVDILKNYEGLKKGDANKIISVTRSVSESNPNEEIFTLLLEDGKTEIPVNRNVAAIFGYDIETVQQFWDAEIIDKVLFSLQKKGTQNDMRSDLEEDALEYVQRVQAAGLEFSDPFLETYIYSLIAKVAPQTLIDGRPSNVNLLILNDPAQNASMYPNGTLVITTGLLSVLHSEDELVAILSHEIAHFVLDHSIQNINEAAKRQKRAEFWSSVLTGVAAAADVAMASKNKYYTPGVLTAGTAILSISVASEINKRMGMVFNGAQENAADEVARRMLEFLGYDQNALATALNQIKDQNIKERNKGMYFASYTHPALVDRIKLAGKPITKPNKEYEKLVSFAVTSAALQKYQNRRYRQVLPLVEQNIENNVGTSDDYLLKANCLLALFNDNSKNNEVLALVNKAKELDPSNINIFKAEIIANLRLKATRLALDQLQDYITKLRAMEDNLSSVGSPNTWDSNYSFIRSELEWANKMTIKLKGM